MLSYLTLVVSLLVGQTETPHIQPPDVEVARLVRQLNAPQLAEREAAEAELLRRGPAILDLLPPVTDRTPAEVRERLGRVRQQLERQAANAVADASTITLRAEAMRLSKILAAFEHQSGNAIIDGRSRFGQPVTDPLLKAHFDKVPFWAALAKVLDDAGLTVDPYSGRAIEIVAVAGNRRAGRSRACYSGPFRIAPIDVVTRGLRRPEDQSLVVSVEVTWEPRVQVIQLVNRMADVSATDTRQRAVTVADVAAVLEAAGTDQTMAAKFDLPFRLPSRDVKQIASLKGKLTATIAGKVESFRFQNLAAAKNVTQRIASATVTLEGVQKMDHGFDVRILVRFDDAGDALASHRTWVFDNPAYLEGPDGKPIRYETFDTTAQNKDSVGLAFRFTTALPLNQLRFVYQTPGAIIHRTYPYELSSIELP
jgi:hypothetical protein